VKARSVIFFVLPDQMADVERRIHDEVLPRFAQCPEFLGFVALQSDGSRPEVTAMSFWNDGLEGSEAISEEFRDEIEGVTGSALARREFTIVKLMIRDSNGEICLDLPTNDVDADPRCPHRHRLVDGSSEASGQSAIVMFCPTCDARYRRQPDGTFTRV
jgi:hypothetical protein